MKITIEAVPQSGCTGCLMHESHVSHCGSFIRLMERQGLPRCGQDDGFIYVVSSGDAAGDSAGNLVEVQPCSTP